MPDLEMFSLKDRVALVPGGGGGIGAPMAEAYQAWGDQHTSGVLTR